MARTIVRREVASKEDKFGGAKKKNYNSWNTQRMKSAIEEFKCQWGE